MLRLCRFDDVSFLEGGWSPSLQRPTKVCRAMGSPRRDVEELKPGTSGEETLSIRRRAPRCIHVVLSPNPNLLATLALRQTGKARVIVWKLRLICP
jgi:hypothetical protein